MQNQYEWIGGEGLPSVNFYLFIVFVQKQHFRKTVVYKSVSLNSSFPPQTKANDSSYIC